MLRLSSRLLGRHLVRFMYPKRQYGSVMGSTCCYSSLTRREIATLQFREASWIASGTGTHARHVIGRSFPRSLPFAGSGEIFGRYRYFGQYHDEPVSTISIAACLQGRFAVEEAQAHPTTPRRCYHGFLKIRLRPHGRRRRSRPAEGEEAEATGRVIVVATFQLPPKPHSLPIALARVQALQQPHQDQQSKRPRSGLR